jgi:hypothetical protein
LSITLAKKKTPVNIVYKKLRISLASSRYHPRYIKWKKGYKKSRLPYEKKGGKHHEK